MFFLIRMAFWLAVVLMLLPISTSEDGTRQIGAFQALGAAQSAFSDVGGFCQRQPDACAVGGQLLAHLGDKAQAGAKWLYENIGSAQVPVETGDTAPPAVHSLTPQDLAPAWGGAIGEAQKPAAPAAPSIPLPPRRPA
ncbi:DUF5330 domain-containing protein [Aquabacter spiritensis]|uniref:DUF5330 domain-containing protein n=1 Tax=Aquabacter spiritensis TaxID=933073 RepID=A0A4R3LR63_9HYPH|nr:DUF5330 domain-containing protein [Aquabacter spiritensis]TCT02972.1 hypothetical protein EDC64_111144 [Aquabacter spiritensis]